MNLNKMFYTSIANLPFFVEYNINNEILAEELGKIYLYKENQNKESGESSITDMVKSSGRINLVNKKYEEGINNKSKDCKC